MVKLVEILYLAISKITQLFNKGAQVFNAQTSAYPNATKSIILHIFILLSITGLLPTCSRKVEPPKYISVSIMPLSVKGNNAAAPGKIEPNKEVKPEPPKPEVKPEDKKPTEKPEEVKKPPVKQVLEKPKFTEKKPVEKKPVEKPVEKPTPDKSKDAKKKSEDKIKKKEEEAIDDFKESLLKNMEESEDGDPTEKPNNKKTSIESKSSAGQGGSTPDAAFVNEIMSKIQSRVSQCWSIPIGAKNVDNMQVAIGITFSSAGDVLKVGVVDTMRYSTDLTYRVLADSAVRAVKECSPIPGLPADKYSDWKEVELNFNPKDML